MHGLGRIPSSPDDRDYSVERLKGMEAAGLTKPLDRKVPSILNQGAKGTCCSAGTLGAINCALGKAKFHNKDIVPFFLQIPGHGPLPDGGAQVRDALKTAKRLRYILAYAPLTSQAAIDDWLENHGPVVYGTDWLSGMDTPNAEGQVFATGSVRGGHCYYGNGNLMGLKYTGKPSDSEVQSWGRAWSLKGHFWMLDTDMGTLQRNSEAWGFVIAA